MHIFLKEQIIKLEDNIEINQGKEEEKISYSRINLSTNLQLYNNSSKVVIDKLGKNKIKNKREKKNKNIKNLNFRLLGWWRYIPLMWLLPLFYNDKGGRVTIKVLKH